MNDQSTGVYFLYRYRKLFFLALLLGGITGAGLTFFISPKYLSTAVVYPYNSHTRDQLVSNPQFGYEIETEQLLQLLSSKSMRDRTIEHFKLYEYYKLDTSLASWNADLTLRYINDITFMRSKYLSVVINVTLKDPELAAAIANYQVDEINRYRASIFEQNRQADFKHVKSQFQESEKEVDRLRDSIYNLKGNKTSLLFNFIENLNNENYDPSVFVDNPQLEHLVVDYRFAYNRFLELRSTYEILKRQLNEPIPSVYSVDVATPSYKKVSPSFIINTLLGAVVFLPWSLPFVLHSINGSKLKRLLTTNAVVRLE